jgi:geranylgeranyl diphosphate synthase type II
VNNGEGSPARAGGFSFGAWLEHRRARVESELARIADALGSQTTPRLGEAMRHALLAGGKRLRPVLATAAAEAVGGSGEGLALELGCAIELVHTYSLIHDDLPAMDDDDMRRGRPTCHRVYGEAMAILAGDGLLTEAFGLLARPGPDAAVRCRLCSMLARAAGTAGMVGGQADDIAGDWPRSVEFLESLHRRKTGALIALACAGGAVAVGADEERVAALGKYGVRLGLAFQIADDLMDESGDPAKLGKSTGKDARSGKVTFPALLGREESLRRARAESEAARQVLIAARCATEPLLALADFAVERDH